MNPKPYTMYTPPLGRVLSAWGIPFFSSSNWLNARTAYVCMCLCVYVCACVRVYIYVHLCASVCICVHLCASVCICVHVH